MRFVFGAPVLDSFACTEGLFVGKAAPGDDVSIFNTDMCIVEFVDADYRPVPIRAGSADSRRPLKEVWRSQRPGMYSR